MPDFLLMVLRSLLAFIFLLILTRIMGKKQLSHLTFFDYVTGITIGSIAATFSIDKKIEIFDGLVSLAIWGILPILLGYFGLKSRKFSQLTDGKPAILIRNGEVLEDAMRKNHLVIDELMKLLREKDIFKIDDIEMAILETNGQLSVMKKSELEPITPKLLGIKVNKEEPPSLLIVDGHLLEKNLSVLGYSEKWLLNEIKKFGATSISEVFLAQVDSTGKLFIDLYSDNKSKKDE